jgi:tRNA-splicing ligase RtcB (3'-phosphate/5'-hydroxy nucleic acid ligase)
MDKKIFNYGLNVEQEALDQFRNCYEKDFVVSAALMPDAHSGYAAPIGAVIITKGYVVPAWVGFDIGCGMIAVKIKGKDIAKKIKESSKEIYTEVNKRVPMGKGEVNTESKISQKSKDRYNEILQEYKKGDYNKEIYQFLKNSAIRHLGTLGGGNHFIEIGEHDKEIWLIIHSGSRGVGYKIAEKYMIQASGSKEKKDYEKTFPLDVNSKIGKEYLNVLNFCLEFALLNRLEMAQKVIESIKEVIGEDVKSELWVNKNHNHAIPEKDLFIHRKGATPAKKDERGVIPANMRDGCFLVTGLGNKKFLESSSHGAGRILSRKKAKEKISFEEFKKSMEGIQGTVNLETIDEAPMAYKDVNKVMDMQKESVKIVKHIKPVINWKGK